MPDPEAELQSVDDIPQEVRVVSERPSNGVATPIITVESLQRYVEDERSRNRQALMWTSTLFLFIVLLVLVMFLSVGIYVLRRTRDTSNLIVGVRQQNSEQASTITHISGKLDHVATMQSEVSDAIDTAEERRVRSEEDVRNNLERFGKWVASGKSRDKDVLATMDSRLSKIEEVKKVDVDEIALLREQYADMQSMLAAMAKSHELMTGQLVTTGIYSPGEVDINQAISGIVTSESAVVASADSGAGSDGLADDWMDGALASVEDLMASEIVAGEEQGAKGDISVVTFPNGDRYEGGFDKGLFSGWGVYYYHNGDRYDGEFRNDMKSGRGTFKFSNGDKYIGKFKDDMMDGYGTFMYAKGDRYVGEFKGDMRSGKGAMVYKNGNKYSGGFKNGEKSGNGIFRFGNGDIYKGEFKSDARNGNGTYNYISGAKYIGEFVNGRRQGKGRYVYEGGEEYIGTFKNGRKDGRGVCVYPNGMRLKGVWTNDKFTRRIK